MELHGVVVAENGPIERLAEIVSDKVLTKFKWKQVGPCNQDFKCLKQNEHKPATKKQEHTHPVDVVFSYKDPYTNKTVLLNTDLKSYAIGSISKELVQGSLNSLARTIDCASNSQEWLDKYRVCVGDYEIRGMLFVYNHDNKFDKDFYEYFYPERQKAAGSRKRSPIKLESFDLAQGHQLHIVEPNLIKYMMAITADMHEMISEGKFPREDYGFYYPQLTLHKVLTSEEYLPATIELISAAYMLIKHGAVEQYDKQVGELKEVYSSGYVIYYNRNGGTDQEFLYLLDTLARYQLLNASTRIRIRVAHSSPSGSLRSNFNRAIQKFAHEWGFDESATRILENIQLHICPVTKEFYSSEDIGWGVENV